jgi:hypothetical protein
MDQRALTTACGAESSHCNGAHRRNDSERVPPPAIAVWAATMMEAARHSLQRHARL